MPGRPACHVSRITMRISSFHFPPHSMAYVPSFFFARKQFLLPRKAFWVAGGGALPALFTPYWLIVS